MGFIEKFIAEHELLFYGSIGFFILLVLFLIGYFIFKPIVEVYLEKNRGWYLLGFIIVGLLSWNISDLFAMPICFNLPFNFLCYYPLKFVCTVGGLLLFWKVTKEKCFN